MINTFAAGAFSWKKSFSDYWNFKYKFCSKSTEINLFFPEHGKHATELNLLGYKEMAFFPGWAGLTRVFQGSLKRKRMGR